MEQINDIISKVEELSEAKLELKSIEEFQKNIGELKGTFKDIFEKSKETEDFINKLDLAQIVEDSMDLLQDEFYDKFVPPMKFLEKLTKKTKETKAKAELNDFRKQLQRRIIDAQKLFSDTIRQTPYELKIAPLENIRNVLIPQLEKQTDLINKNVDGIEDEVYEELSNNYKELLEILRSLKLEIQEAYKQLEENKKEVEKLASTSAWIKEQLAQREKELEEKDAEAGEMKAQLEEREKELQAVKADLDKQLEDKAAESAKMEEMLAEREKALAALQEETSLSKAELKKRQKKLEKEIAKTKSDLEAKASESDEIKAQLAQRESELIGTIEATKASMESTAVAIEETEHTKKQLEEQLKEKNLEIERLKTEIETQTKTIKEKETEVIEIKKQLKETRTVMVEKEQEYTETRRVLTKKVEEAEDAGVSEEELNKLQKEIEEKEKIISEKEKEIEKIKAAQKEEAEGESEKIKKELDDLLAFLEKSPRYQLLYLINNEEKIDFPAIEELLKFDNVIIKTLLDDLTEMKFIDLKGKGEAVTASIVQKLNPLSCIEFKTIFENKMFLDLKKQQGIKETETYFDKCLDKINEHKVTNKQEAGFLLSLLYLYIYDAKKFEFFSKIRDLYAELKPHSFYLRLVENALTYDPWESKKTAILENLIDFPEMNILNTDYEEISEKDEAYPKNGPFIIEKAEPISLIDWQKEIKIEKSRINEYSNLKDLAKWVWLNAKGSNFKVELKNSKGKTYNIIVSVAKKVKELIITKHQELIAG